MPKKILRFGGPGLKTPGKFTWYNARTEGGGYKQVRAEIGHEVPVEDVVHLGKTPNADYYVENGLAEIVTSTKERKPRPKPITAGDGPAKE